MNSLALECGTLFFSLKRCDVTDSNMLPFDTKRPELDTMVLSCGHEFHAVGLVFHWALNNNVTCPMCHKGQSSRLKLELLPTHLRGPVEIRKLASLYGEAGVSALEQMSAETRAEYLRPGRLCTQQRMRQLQRSVVLAKAVVGESKLHWLTADFHLPIGQMGYVHDVIKLTDLISAMASA